MNIPDLINGAFETTGGFVCFLNIRRLLKDRKVEGVDWRVSAFFSTWGFWNLYFYPSLHQWFSFLGGVGLVLTNTAWVCLALRTIRLNRHMGHKAFDDNCVLCQDALSNDPAFDKFLSWLSESAPPQQCTRESGHTGPCNGWPCAFRQAQLSQASNLPEIKHTYKCECECDLCVDRGNIS